VRNARTLAQCLRLRRYNALNKGQHNFVERLG